MEIYSIYKVTNLVDGKMYIGYTKKDPIKRFTGHVKEARTDNYKFHNALNKYGPDNFIVETVYQSLDHGHTLNIMEPYFIKEYNTFRTDNGYNMTPGGDSGPVLNGKDNGMFNTKHSEESLQLMSQNRKGKCLGDANPSKRPEVRAKLKIANCGVNNGMYGKTHSAESNRKRGESVSKALKGVPKKKVACPHCGKVGGSSNMKRYHFDNCKSKG